jgi:hypothetical protein
MAGLSVLGLGSGTWLFFSAFGRLKLKRAVANTPTSKAAAAAMGKCELKGRARAGIKPLQAPFSGAACTWVRWKVEEEYVDSRGNAHWSTVLDNKSMDWFLLEDSSGRVWVNPLGAEVDAPQLLRYTRGLFFSNDLPQGPEAYLWLASKRRRLTEWRIDEGVPVYALGLLRPQALSPEQAAALVDPPAPAPTGEQGVLGQGKDGEIFFLAAGKDADERALLSDLEWSVGWRMVLGPMLAALALGMLIKLFTAF